MGKLCLALTACWLVLAISISTPARQPQPQERMAAGNWTVSGPEPPEADEQQPAGDAQTQAQQQTQPQQGEQKPAEPEKKTPGQPLQNGISKDRLFYLLPNFLTLENASNVPPLTSGQKFKAVARGTFDPVQFCYYVVIAGIGQAADNEPGYGQGMQGYGKRFGAIVADSTIENFMVGAVMPSLLRQDPRYFQAGKGPVLHRVWYALTRIFVTRGDDGHRQFNASEIFGSAMAAGISTYSYHPEADRGFRNLGDTWATQVGLDSFANAMKEFWPDIRRHFHKKGAAAADTKTPGR